MDEKYKQQLKERIKNKIQIDENGCWIWTGSKSGTNKHNKEIDTKYGMIKLKNPRRSEAAHRVSYKVFVGDIPNGLFCCHKCDVKLCVNPEHLFIGTAKDNMQDLLNKGLHPYRKRRKGTKISSEDAKYIYSVSLSKDRPTGYRKKLAEKFKISMGLVDLIRQKKIFKWATKDVEPTILIDL